MSPVGTEFMFNWSGKTVSDQFVYLKRMMPPTMPGSHSDRQYADAMAALFSPAHPLAVIAEAISYVGEGVTPTTSRIPDGPR